MKRDFLKELGLTDEQIDKVMTENGKDIQKHKDNFDKEKLAKEKSEENATSIGEQLEEANKQIESFKDMDIEGIKKSADDWKTKYEADTKALKEAMQKKDYEHTVDNYLASLEFTSDFAKKAFKSEFLGKELKLDNGKLLGADDFIAEFKESNKGVFAEKEAKEDTQKGEIKQENNMKSPYNYVPKGNGEGVDDLAQLALQAVQGNI